MKESRVAHCVTLHVFEQDGGWHWALTVERTLGAGKRVIAFSGPTFDSEAQARNDGKRALAQTHEEVLAEPRENAATSSEHMPLEKNHC